MTPVKQVSFHHNGVDNVKRQYIGNGCCYEFDFERVNEVRDYSVCKTCAI